MKRAYKEQKQILKEALQQAKTKELIDKEYTRNERERLLKKEVERISDAFRLLIAIFLLPLLTILSVVPLTILLAVLVLFIIKEMLLGMFRLTTLPFKKL